MQEKLKKMKTSLDTTVYKDRIFTEDLQELTIQKAMEGGKKSRFYSKSRSILAVPIAIMVAVILFLSLDSEILKGNLVDSSTNKNGSEVNDNHRILVVTESDKDAPSVLLLAINQKKNEIKYVNIPHRLKYKDSMIEFKTENGQLIENDFEELLGISIDQKLITSLEKLGEMVENVGGIRVRNGFEFSEGGIRFPEGDIDLFKSEDVVKYTAMRKSDPMGMYGRDNRIVSVMKELITSMDPNKYGFLDVNKDISIIEGERPTLNASIQDGKWFEVVDDASLAQLKEILK